MHTAILFKAATLFGLLVGSAQVLAVAAPLNEFKIESGSQLSRERIQSARVVVGAGTTNQIELNIIFQSNCPKSVICVTGPTPPVKVFVPLQLMKTGHCNQMIYKGQINQLPVDGLRQQLTVTDNRANTCKYLRTVAPTEVTYTVEGGRPRFKHTHRFTGEALR